MAGELKWNPKARRKAHDHARLVAELQQRGHYGKWVFQYDYPGLFLFRHSDNGVGIYFTPDWCERDVVSIQVQDSRQHFLEGSEAILSPRTGTKLFSIVEPWLDKYDHWIPTTQIGRQEGELFDALDAIEFSYSARYLESGLDVEASNGKVTSTEWTMTERPEDEEWEEKPFLKRSSSLQMLFLLDPTRPHRGLYDQDKEGIGPYEVVAMSKEEQEKAIVAAAISYLAYSSEEGEFVSSVGE